MKSGIIPNQFENDASDAEGAHDSRGRKKNAPLLRARLLQYVAFDLNWYKRLIFTGNFSVFLFSPRLCGLKFSYVELSPKGIDNFRLLP
jgi:hypothetical protein